MVSSLSLWRGTPSNRAPPSRDDVPAVPSPVDDDVVDSPRSLVPGDSPSFFFFYVNALSDPGRSCLQDPHACVPPYERATSHHLALARVCVHSRTEGRNKGARCGALSLTRTGPGLVLMSGGCKYIGKGYPIRRFFELKGKLFSLSTLIVSLYSWIFDLADHTESCSCVQLGCSAWSASSPKRCRKMSPFGQQYPRISDLRIVSFCDK